MTVTNLGDASTSEADAQLRIRTDVVDVLMAAKGITTVEAQANAFGLNRTHWFDIRAGRVVPNLKTAMKIATEAGSTVEYLFRRQP